MSSNIICVTTFRQGNIDNPVKRVRAEVFLDTAKKLREFNIPCVTLFTETQADFLEHLKRLGIVLAEQRSSDMGNIRREVISMARSLFPNAEFYCWLEPEKPNLIKHIFPIITVMSRENSTLGLFNRAGMTSYPSEQAYYYLFCRAAASKLMGFDLDYAFGPMIISKSAIRWFLEYNGEYGDKWDAILVPRLRIIKQRMRITLLPINFENDPRMTAVESGNSSVILKRLEQFNNIIPSLIKEWNKLNVI